VGDQQELALGACAGLEVNVVCEECGRRVTSWRSFVRYDEGMEISEAHWVCPCGLRGNRTIITIEVRGSIL
jgi:hypothetical protein